MSTVHLCSFSVGLDELKPKERTEGNVLNILRRDKRFSVFEATANMTIAGILERLEKEGRIKRTGGQFPWIEVEVVD